MSGNTFEPGDIVRLKSGGPTMTVERIGADQMGQQFVAVTWFDSKNEPKREIYPPEALELS